MQLQPNYSTNEENKPLQAALDYARRGWRVFPLHTANDGQCSCGNAACERVAKHPRTINGLKDATIDEDIIRKWWQMWSDANIGIATGSVSGLLVLDVDPRHGGNESIEELERKYTIPETVECLTGGGGRHLYFKHPGGTVPNRANILPGLDIRADGGYVVATPSIHASGKPYMWECEHDPADVELAECPAWLLQLIYSKQNTMPSQSAGVKLAAGGRNNQLTSLAGTMRKRGMSEGAIIAALMAENQTSCDPPLNESEVMQIARSVARYSPECDSQYPQNPHNYEWAEIIPLSSYRLPEFPAACLPDWLRRYVNELSTATQTPIDLSGMLSLSVLAATVAGKVEIMPSEGWHEPLNIYSLVALPPASRKSAVFSEITMPLTEYEKALRQEKAADVRRAQAEYKALEQAIQQAQNEKAKALAKGEIPKINTLGSLTDELENFEMPILPRLVADDSTLEQIAVMMAEQKGKLAVMSAEGDLFDILAGRYSASGTVNIGIVLKGHSGDFVRVDRIGRTPVSIDKPALTIGLAIQPDVLKGLVQRPGFRGRGLLGRFLYSLPESNVGRRMINAKPLTESTRAEYSCRIKNLLDLPGGECAAVLLLDDSAKTIFVEFQEWLEPNLTESGELATIPDWAGKLSGAVARIAGLLHLAEGHSLKKLVSVDTIGKAIQIGRYLKDHAKAAFDVMGDNADTEAAKRFLQWIEKTGASEFKKRDLFQALKGSYPRADMLDTGLSILIDYGYIREKPIDRTGVGRPSMIYEVNPKIADQYPRNPRNPLIKNNIEDIGHIGDGINDIDLMEGVI